LENTLKELKPDEWNNIPICIVTAFKWVMIANEENFKNFKQIDNKLEVIKQSINSQGNKFDRDLKYRDETLRSEFVKSHKDLNEKFEAKITELYNAQMFS
jgi:hypothetical protein